MGADLAGKVVLLTGATGDIGVAYTMALTARGANVVATDLEGFSEAGREIVDKATAQGAGQAVFAGCDITSNEDLQRVVDLASDRFGGLDCLVNNAAIYRTLGPKRTLTELTNDEWDLVLRVNVRGCWQSIRAAVPAMRERGGGRIVNIASVVSRTGAAGFAHYVASKAAVEGLTRAAARELGSEGIAVNAVSPGLVDDAASRDINDANYLERMKSTRSVPRSMEPEDLVGAVVWLCGDGSGFVTGQTIVVDGGGVFV